MTEQDHYTNFDPGAFGLAKHSQLRNTLSDDTRLEIGLFMSKDKNRKERIPLVKILLRDDVHFNWNSEEMGFELLNSKGEISEKHLVSICDTYHREGKLPKVLREVQNPTGGVVKIQKRTVACDRYFAIDTNYKSFGNNYLCATASLCIDQHIDHEKGLIKGDQIKIFSVPRIVFLATPGSKPERYGWMKVVDGLLRFDGFNRDWSYGMIVDSDLDDAPKINAREEPIFGDLYLPENITLMYASADVGRESLINKLIRATDRVAKSSLDHAFVYYRSLESFRFQKEFWDIAVLNDTVNISI